MAEESDKGSRVGEIILGCTWILIIVVFLICFTLALILNNHVWFFAGAGWSVGLFIISIIIGLMTKALK